MASSKISSVKVFITCIPNDRYPLPHLFELLSGGAIFAELTKGTLKRLEILTPPESIVIEFARTASPLFKNIETFLRTSKYLAVTRDKLLPRLVSGKLSVEHLDIHFPPDMVEEATA